MAEETDPIQWEDLPIYNEGDDTDGGGSNIYVFMEEPDPGAGTYYCKVGRATKVDKRRNDLQTGNPRELRIAKEYPVSDAVGAERAAHRELDDCYDRVRGEWYAVPEKEYDSFLRDTKKAVHGY